MSSETTGAGPPDTTELILAEVSFLRRRALNLTRNSSEADDLVQETLMRAYRARKRFEPYSSMRSWLVVIMQRFFLTRVLARKRRRTDSATDLDLNLDFKVDDQDEQASDRSILSLHEAKDAKAFAGSAVAQGLDSSTMRALVRVQDAYREPFLLFSLRGMSYAEIAQLLQIPVGTVMSRIHRARLWLRKELDRKSLSA